MTTLVTAIDLWKDLYSQACKNHLVNYSLDRGLEELSLFSLHQGPDWPNVEAFHLEAA